MFPEERRYKREEWREREVSLLGFCYRFRDYWYYATPDASLELVSYATCVEMYDGTCVALFLRVCCMSARKNTRRLAIRRTTKEMCYDER